MNINIQNNHYQEIIDVVREENPDIALFMEVEPNTFRNLNTRLKDIFPSSFRTPGGGLALFSRLPIKDVRGDKLNANNHNLIATVLINNQPITLIGTHPLVPVKPSTFTKRNLQLAALSDYIATIKTPLIVAGDFNLTPWSPYYKTFVRKTKLHNTRLGYGILPTWIRGASHVHYPQWLLFIMENFLNIPIDHCFVSQDFRVAGIRVGKNANSDHASVVNNLVFTNLKITRSSAILNLKS